MSWVRNLFAVSFRAKVLVPIIGVMICLMALTAWIVDQRITRQFEADATHALATADEAFRYAQEIRHKNMLLRFRELPAQPHYNALFQNSVQSHETLTLREQLDRLLAQPGVDVVLFSSADQKVMTSAERDPLVSTVDLRTACEHVIKQALAGQERADIVRVGGKLYDVVSIPTMDPDGDLNGALTVGSEIGSDVADELCQFTHSQIVLLADAHVAASTIPAADARSLIGLSNDIFQESREGSGPMVIRKQMIAGEHYYCSGGCLASLNGTKPLCYLLLYSYEQPFRSLQTTQQIMLLASGLAILLGSIIVCILVGKVTRPLRELRDHVEAVGRGDFSGRVTVHSRDECGELALVFNQMTENLKNSREQLETTVDTLKNTQAQLIQSEKLSGIGGFIAGVAHELNNPLTSVMGFAELLEKSDVSPTYKRHIEIIHKSAQRCHKIVQALLSFARRRSPERKMISLNGLVESAHEILQYQLRTSNVEMVMKLDPDLPQITVDPHQLQQVLVNLITNALQAIESYQPNGRIKVTTARKGDAIQLIVQDNGPGIPEENLSKIFDPFFTTKEVGKGTGLGLSLCYGIIKEHGGTITPRSRPGEGATFTIELPMTQDEVVETVTETSQPVPETSFIREGAGKKVLVIDDEEAILHMVREALTPRGYEVDTVSDGESALKRVRERNYDVALCDWKMPGLNGEQVYERLRSINPALCSRIIFITGDVINERTQKFLEEQNKICLAKPFTISEFRGAIKKVLAAA